MNATHFARVKFFNGQIFYCKNFSWFVGGLCSWSCPQARSVHNDMNSWYGGFCTHIHFGLSGWWLLISSQLTYSTIFIMTAGNACVLKPSEISVATSNLFNELIPQYLDKVDACTEGNPL